MSPLLLRVLLLVILPLCGISCAEYVPVFMWGATSGSPHKTKGLSKIDGASFKGVLKEQLDSKPFTVVFIEEALSVEDFSSKDQKGRTSYPGLREKMTGDSVVYYPFVASALHTLNKLVDPEKVDRVELTEDGLSADVIPGGDKFLYINLKDAREGEDRMHMLSRHDQFMTSMFDKLLKKHDNVLAIYTARQPSWEVSTSNEFEKYRVARSLKAVNWTGDATPASGFYNVTGTLNVFIFASKMTILDKNNANYSVELTDGTSEMLRNETQWEYVVQLKFATNIVKFKYIIGNDSYWRVGVTLNEGSGDIVMDNTVYAASDFSYHCSPAINFSSTNSTRVLSFDDFQTQIFLRSLTNERFTMAYDCVGFTSVPIWSGLFVTLLFLFITSIGITMMMDIRTMDRFDDPKGKTITITTTE